MIERQKNIVHFICDECLEVLDTEQSEFSNALVVMREEGWSSYKIAEEWRHKCSECRE